MRELADTKVTAHSTAAGTWRNWRRWWWEVWVVWEMFAVITIAFLSIRRVGSRPRATTPWIFAAIRADWFAVIKLFATHIILYIATTAERFVTKSLPTAAGTFRSEMSALLTLAFRNVSMRYSRPKSATM